MDQLLRQTSELTVNWLRWLLGRSQGVVEVFGRGLESKYEAGEGRKTREWQPVEDEDFLEEFSGSNAQDIYRSLRVYQDLISQLN